MTRVLLICHGATAATRRGAFALDEPLEQPTRPAIEALRLRLTNDRSWGRQTAPGALASGCPLEACRQTAEALGLGLETQQTLTPLALGSWAGRTLDEVLADDPAGVQAWLEDPDATPHGGEPLTGFLTRVGSWLDGETSTETSAAHETTTRKVVICDQSVVRAVLTHVLKAPASAFWRIDAAPLSTAELSGAPGRWSLRLPT